MSDRPSSVPPNQAQASVPSGSHCRKAAWLWTTGEDRKASARPAPAAIDSSGHPRRDLIRGHSAPPPACGVATQMDNFTTVVKLEVFPMASASIADLIAYKSTIYAIRRAIGLALPDDEWLIMLTRWLRRLTLSAHSGARDRQSSRWRGTTSTIPPGGNRMKRTTLLLSSALAAAAVRAGLRPGQGRHHRPRRGHRPRRALHGDPVEHRPDHHAERQRDADPVRRDRRPGRAAPPGGVVGGPGQRHLAVQAARGDLLRRLGLRRRGRASIRSSGR